MLPRAATVGRAAIGLTTMSVVWRNVGADKARGCAIHSDNHFLTLLQRPRTRAGVRFSFAGK